MAGAAGTGADIGLALSGFGLTLTSCSHNPQRVLRAKPERVYRAFLDLNAMVKWLPPHGFTGRVQRFDAWKKQASNAAGVGTGR